MQTPPIFHENGTSAPSGRALLGLFDVTSVLIGITIGAGIFELVPLMVSSTTSTAGMIAVWIAGGIVSLCGGLCYAELAGMFPRYGGDLHYLGAAYGARMGFLFAWGRSAIVHPGGIAGMALVCARYLRAVGLEGLSPAVLACVLIFGLTALHTVRVITGIHLQNLLTITKATGLLLVGSAFLFVPSRQPQTLMTGAPISDWGLGFVLVLFCFGGWNEVAYIVPDIRDPGRAVPRALVVSILAVALLYGSVVVSYLAVLGVAGTMQSTAPAVDLFSQTFPWAASMVGMLIAISTLGSAHGMIFTGARISVGLGQCTPRLRFLAQWNRATNSPALAYAIQGALAILIVLLSGSFADVVVYTTTVAWFFFLLAGVSLLVLRRCAPDAARSFRSPGYPLVPIVFCAGSAYACWSAFSYNPKGSLISVVLLVAGLFFAPSAFEELECET